MNEECARIPIKRRLGILGDLLTEFVLTLSAVAVPSQRNKVVSLTRINKIWLAVQEVEKRQECKEVEKLHCIHYMQVEMTLYVIRKVNLLAKREVRKMIKNRVRYQYSSVHDPG